ncbi:MAG: NfeD family protein [Desulfovermiculus sp.]
MVKTGWSRRAVVTYILIQLPGMLLLGLALMVIHAQFQLPVWAGWFIFFIWVVKDIILFFFLWPAYDNQSRDVYSLVGQRAVAITDINPQGRVRLHGQTWPARAEGASQAIPAGNPVEVIGQEGLVLTVQLCLRQI